METTQPRSKGALWTGRIFSGLVILFFLFDAGGKVFKEIHHVEGTAKFGFGPEFVSIIGWILLVCTILHAIPRTAILGAILCTAYLGGAVAVMMRVGEPYPFPIVMGILMWVGLYLRDDRLRNIVN